LGFEETTATQKFAFFLIEEAATTNMAQWSPYVNNGGLVSLVTSIFLLF